ncbi:MAG: type I methionyl aminopeptidase [Candidatus Omnitrophica bacterium]|nr:type I methionyl aminopeptidase [Candidatus Omnitrophota bacterium]MCM8832206.1 type I methionyl aminopeptidase [Candidatus Omnitrophota bacterium]
MIELLTYKDLLLMRQSGKVASEFLRKLKTIIKPGISTKDIEIFFEKTLDNYLDMKPAFKGFCGYPASLCVSVNEEIIHGIPTANKFLKEGDIVSVDLGITYKGLFVDTAYTYFLNPVSKLALNLIHTAYKALKTAILAIKIGKHIGDIGFTIENFVERRGFSVIKKFVGHGVGRNLHCPPQVPNFGIPGSGERLLEGMVLAIEPMVVAGSNEIEILEDGWTVKTKDNSLSAHFEHTVAVTKKGAWVLTE